MNLTRQSKIILSRLMMPVSSVAALWQERITVTRKSWATGLAVLTKSTWYICVIRVTVLSRARVLNIINVRPAYLDCISNDACLVF